MGHIKLWDNLLECPKVHRLSDPTFRCWIKLLCCALRNGGRNGEFPALETLVFRLRLSEEKIDACIKEMHQCCLIDPCPENEIGGMPWRIHDWEQWQLPRDPKAALRQAKWREKRSLRNALHNGVTNAVRDGDKEEELKEEVNPPLSPRRRGEKNAFVPPDWMPAQDWEDYKCMRVAVRKRLTFRGQQLAVEALDKLRGEGQSVSAVLRQATLGSHTNFKPIVSDRHKSYSPGLIGPAQPKPVLYGDMPPEEQARVDARSVQTPKGLK